MLLAKSEKNKHHLRVYRTLNFHHWNCTKKPQSFDDGTMECKVIIIIIIIIIIMLDTKNKTTIQNNKIKIQSHINIL